MFRIDQKPNPNLLNELVFITEKPKAGGSILAAGSAGFRGSYKGIEARCLPLSVSSFLFVSLRTLRLGFCLVLVLHSVSSW